MGRVRVMDSKLKNHNTLSREGKRRKRSAGTSPGKAGASGLDVSHDLTLELLDSRELHLRPDAVEKSQSERPIIEITGEIQKKGLDPVLVLAKSRSVADIDNGIGGAAVPRGASDVDAGREGQRPVG